MLSSSIAWQISGLAIRHILQKYQLEQLEINDYFCETEPMRIKYTVAENFQI